MSTTILFLDCRTTQRTSRSESLLLLVPTATKVGSAYVCFSARGLIAADRLSQVVGLGLLIIASDQCDEWNRGINERR